MAKEFLERRDFGIPGTARRWMTPLFTPRDALLLRISIANMGQAHVPSAWTLANPARTSPHCFAAVARAGATVAFAGVVTTPAWLVLFARTIFKPAWVISASHNPFQDNGGSCFRTRDEIPAPSKKSWSRDIEAPGRSRAKESAALAADESLDAEYSPFSGSGSFPAKLAVSGSLSIAPMAQPSSSAGAVPVSRR